MIGKIEELLRRVEEFRPKTAAEVEEFRIKVLGKKGELNALMEEFKRVAPELKREVGQRLNALKQAATERVAALRAELQESRADDAEAIGDPTRPGSAEQLGSRHPISLVKNQIVEIFSRLGYTVADGPEIEDDWHVFSALNFPPEHPARDMQDTFFIEKNPDILLRTHTSSIQVRTMEHQRPPIRVICPGRVFRNEAISYRAHCIFHQIEGLYIDEGVSFADLKQSLLFFAKELFGEQTDAAVVLPLHRTLGRGRRLVQPLRRQGLSGLQGHGLAGDSGLRHGRPQRIGGQRHRSAEIFGLRLRHGHRTYRHAQIRRG